MLHLVHLRLPQHMLLVFSNYLMKLLATQTASYRVSCADDMLLPLRAGHHCAAAQPKAYRSHTC